MVMKTERKPWEKITVTDVLIVVILAVIGFIMFFPFYNSVVLSLNEGKDAQLGGIYFWPRAFTLDNYKKVFVNAAIWRAFAVSTLRVITGTSLSLLVTSMFAYAASKPHLKFRKFYLSMVLVSMYFSGGLIPTFLVIRSIGLMNNFLVYIVTWAFNAFYSYIFLSFFRGMPAALIESAKIDGAGEWLIYFRIVMPLSKAPLAAVGLFTAVNHWNAWNDNMLYVKEESLTTLSYMFVRMIKSQEMLENAAAAVSEMGRASGVSSITLQLATMMVSVVPILFVYPFVQKHFTSGIMIGSIKG